MDSKSMYYSIDEKREIALRMAVQDNKRDHPEDAKAVVERAEAFLAFLKG